MNWKRALFATLGVGAPVIALLSYGMTRDPREIPSPLPGRAAPVFSRAVIAPGDDSILRRPVGDTVHLAGHRGQVVVINFWASWCLACRDEHEALSTTAQRFARDGVRFYGMLYNDQVSNGINWIARMGGQTYPALSDPGARAAIDYGLYGVPETFVVDQDGHVARKYLGPVSRAQLTKLIDSLLDARRDTASTASSKVATSPTSVDQVP